MTSFEPIAIVGRACLLPGAFSPEELWEAVHSGRDLLSCVPPDRWGVRPDRIVSDELDSTDLVSSDRGGYVVGFDEVFDSAGFSITPEELNGLDPVFLWTLHTAREALRDAGHAGSDPAHFGAVFGNLSFPSAGMAAFIEEEAIRAVPGYGTQALEEAGIQPSDPRNRFNSGLPALVLERALKLGAGALALDAACASSLYAIKIACDRLHDNDANLMLAGAVNCADDLCIHMGFTALTALSRTGQSRPFHADADGLVPSEGCGFVVLRRLQDAVLDGDTIHGVIRGVGLSNDGRSRGLLVPSSAGQTVAIAQALRMANLAPKDISLLECHATGTQIGDATEIQSSVAIYGESGDMPIGSLKSNTGHLITAAGVAGVIKVIEAMKHRTRPQTLHADKPLAEVSNSSFRLLTANEPWEPGSDSDGLMRAGVSAFGFGGNNAHLILEEPPSPGERTLQPDSPAPAQGAVAIVSIGVSAASAIGREAFTDALLHSHSCLDENGHGTMPSIALDIAKQKFPPNDLEKALGQQLAMLAVTDEAIGAVDVLRTETTGVYVGMGTDPDAARFGLRWRIPGLAQRWGASPEWASSAQEASSPPLDAARVVGSMPNIAANRLNSQYDLSGPSMTVSAEERSGTHAFDLAVRALRSGEIDAAVVGAVDLSCNPAHQAAAIKCLNEDHQTPGDAAVTLVLKRFDDAERDGDTVFAVVAGHPGDDGTQVCAADLKLTTTGEDDVLTPLFGHAHAASGLLRVAAAAICLHHRQAPGGRPLLGSSSEGVSTLPLKFGPRTAVVAAQAMDGITAPVLWLAEAEGHPAPALPDSVPSLHIYSGSTTEGVLAALEADTESKTGPARVVIVANGSEQRDARVLRAIAHLKEGASPGPGIHYRSQPIVGELAYVFTAAGVAYHGMGAKLLRAIPELTNPIARTFPFGKVAGWMFDPQEPVPTPNDYLWGTALLSQAHVHLTKNVLKLRPAAAIGYSSGESNSLFAFGVWSDMDAMRMEIDASGMMESELGGHFEAVARAWEEPSARWAVWNVLAPLDEVRSAIANETRVHLTIINTAGDAVIAGDLDGCERVVEALGRRRCRPVRYNLACHVPEVRSAFHKQWKRIHKRKVTPTPDVRFYSNGTNSAYDVSTKACAKAITYQAEHTVDFPATIQAAYDDGVRIFVEHGPAGACTNFIRSILNGKDVLAVQLDRKEQGVAQVFDAAAALISCGVDVDYPALVERLTPAAVHSTPSGSMMRFALHSESIHLPARPKQALPVAQFMEPAPALPPVLASARVPAGSAVAGTATHNPSSPRRAGPRPHGRDDGPHGDTEARVEPGEAIQANPVARAIESQMAIVVEGHGAFVAQQNAIHQQFLSLRIAAPPSVAAGATFATSTVGSNAPSAPPVNAIDPFQPPWGKEQLRIHSSGRISELFGPSFSSQDGRAIQCRMPEPPLLLADRVTGMDCPQGELGRGTIWTETDVVQGAWYLNQGYMPAGFMIESGQADLMLISYMGIDKINDPGRSYRLLGCTLTYHGNLPAPGETLAYEIRITGHAKHGEIRLFFFEYDCVVDGEARLTVRDAQAGFFTEGELAEALGILWTPEEGRLLLRPDAIVDGAEVVGTKDHFSKSEVAAFSEGRALDCFGPGFEWTQTHTRTPKIQDGQQLFIDEITTFDPTGGPWQRGFMRCETQVAPDAWFFDGHFKNDPCMPGNFMVEACVQSMSFYLAALGYTTKRDGWRFQPLPEQPFELKCRGEINPSTKHVAYELHVEEVRSGPHPTIICDVVGFVDGKPAFHAHRIGVELVPDWPLTSMPERYEEHTEANPVATDPSGFPFDWKAMISCAWGKPSEAFGSMYREFDGIRRSPRLPGEPYHFISRIVEIKGDLDDCKAGMEITCEYDIPRDAWYFDENGAETMPYAVVLEAALQPCGWVASAVGSATGMTEDLLFRNLDGTANQTGELSRTAGTLTTKVKLTSVSRAGGMLIEAFDVECFLGDRSVYTMQTVFGFFPPEAFEDQVGLPVDENHRLQLETAPGQWIDLSSRPARYCSGDARLAEPMLLMLDRATLTPDAGEAGLGVVRGEKAVHINEWFFKAHFFQDPVQPGSLGIEALAQLLQFYMLEKGMAEGLATPHFEPLMLGRPMSWKYRGQVTPANNLISSVMEITEVGMDGEGPFVIGRGSLWCDGLRIYEVANMGMRISNHSLGPLQRDRRRAEMIELPLVAAQQAMTTYWTEQRGTPERWLGQDLLSGLFDRNVHRILIPDAEALADLAGRSAIYLANHQVQIESLMMSNLLPALSGVPMTTIANAKHRQRWIGEMIRALEEHPDCTPVEQTVYFDQSRPASMFDILAAVREKMAAGPHSLFLHADGTRSRSCRDRTIHCSAAFIDLAIAMDVPIVPIRFSGGLPVEPIAGKAEFPFGHGKQDYWIGRAIEPSMLASLHLRDRRDLVLDAINALGGGNDLEEPLPQDPAFTNRVKSWQRTTGTHEVFAAAWEVLQDCENPSEDTQILLNSADEGTHTFDAAERGPWLRRMAALLRGGPDTPAPGRRSGQVIGINRRSHPQLLDHVVNRNVVVPVAHVVDWLAKSAAEHAPALTFSELRDVRVLGGVVAGGYESGADIDVVVSATTVDAATVKLELHTEGRLRYSAIGVVGPSPIAPIQVPSLRSGATPLSELYDGVTLFHGPMFQVLEDVRLGEDGMSASVSDTRHMSWPDHDWAVDPALVDGALQMALLWTKSRLGCRSLPTTIQRIRVFSPGDGRQLQATLLPVDQRSNSVRSTVVLTDSDDNVCLEITGIETHCLPSDR